MFKQRVSTDGRESALAIRDDCVGLFMRLCFTLGGNGDTFEVDTLDGEQ